MKSTKVLNKGFGVILSSIMVLTLAACGGGNKAVETGTSSPAVVSSGTPATEAVTEAPKSDVKLKMWHFKVAFDPGIQAVAEAFKKKTGITVETDITADQNTYVQKVLAAGTANNLPDVYMHFAGAAGGALDGKAMSWTDELNNDNAWKDSFFPAALSGNVTTQGNVDAWQKDEKASDWQKERKVGEYWGIPLDVGSFFMIYANKKLLEESGIPLTAPATMEELLKNMDQVKEKTKTPGLVFSAKTFSLYEYWFAGFEDYMKNGPEEFTKFMTRDAKMTDPAHFHIAKFVEDVTKSGNMLPGAVTLDIDPSDQAFAQGKAAYTLGGTFTLASITQMGMKAEDVISFRVPAYEGSKVADAKVTPFPLVQVLVTDNGPHKKEAIEFVKFLTSEEGMTLYTNGSSDLPAVNLKNKDALSPSLKAMLESLSSESNWFSENPVYMNNIYIYPEWQKFHEMKQKIILGKATAQEAAEAFDKVAAAEKAKAAK